MYEVKVLSALIESRREYESAHRFIRHNDLSPIGLAVFRAIGDYYNTDAEASSVDTEILTAALERKFSSVPKHLQELKDYLTELFSVDTSAVNVARELLNQERDAIGAQLAEAILRRGDADDIERKLVEFNEIMAASSIGGQEEDAYKGIHLGELEHIYAKENLIKIAPPALNDRLRGGMIRGQSIIIAAMPEAGKSLVALNMTAGFCHQKLKTLYVGNEDPIEELVLRLLSNLSGIKGEDLFKHKEVVMERALERGYDLVTFQGLDPGSVPEIDALLRKEQYDCLVVDQLRNLTAKTENNTARLEAVAQGARNLARRHDVLTVAVTQAAESARDKLVLNSGDIDSSNIGIPGACDVMVMVGMNDDYYLRDLRRMTLTKNKRGGVHDNFSVSIDRSRSRIKNYGGLQ